MRCSTILAVISAALFLSARSPAQDVPAWFRQAPGGFPTPSFVTPVGYTELTGDSADGPAQVLTAAPLQAPATTVPAQAPLAVENPASTVSPSIANGYCPTTYGYFDGLYWHRVGTGCDQILATNTALPPGADTVLSTSNLHFNGTGGFRVLVGWRPDPACCPLCCAWEASYWGIFGWNANQTVRSSTGELAIPGDLGLASNNFFLTNMINVNYQSQMNNVELNCVKSCCLCCSQIDFLCGFRYINLNETLTITGTDFQEGTSNYNVHTDNNLYGLQLGGRFTRPLTDLWSLQLTGKSGLFYNDVHQTQQATDFPNNAAPFSLRDRISARGSAVAALGELDFIFIRMINDMWSLRLGYSVIGLGGLALAPDQLDFTDTFTSGSRLHTNGWILVHGGLIGLQARW